MSRVICKDERMCMKQIFFIVVKTNVDVQIEFAYIKLNELFND